MRTKIIIGVLFATLFLAGVFIGFRPQITERVQASVTQWQQFRAGINLERCVNQSGADVTLMGTVFENGRMFLSVSVLADNEEAALTAYATVLRCAVAVPDWFAVSIVDYYFQPIQTVDDWDVHYTSYAFLGVIVERSLAEEVVASEKPEMLLMEFGARGLIQTEILANYAIPLPEGLVTPRGVALAIERVKERVASKIQQ